MNQPTINQSVVLDRERRKRKVIETRVLLFTTRFNKACSDLEKKIDLLIDDSRKAQEELFKTPYKNWRTND